MNSFGHNFRISVWGESHGRAIGVTLDGVPAGLPLTENDFAADLSRRHPHGKGATERAEQDIPEILSGVYEEHTTGAPLTVIFRNEDARSEDYAPFVDTPRPGHADFAASVRFDGWNDPRGGGQFSGRLTLGMVVGGVIAKKILALTVTDPSDQTPASPISAEITSLGGSLNPNEWESLIAKAESDGDSLGAVVECTANVCAGYGEPFWDSVESLISHAVFAIPGVRGIEFGDGFRAASMKGSQHNDPFAEDGLPAKNGSGGCNGGITNGAPVKFRVAFKPTSSIARKQSTLNFATGEMTNLKIKGRHDTCFALRTPVIVEAATAIVLADLILGTPSGHE